MFLFEILFCYTLWGQHYLASLYGITYMLLYVETKIISPNPTSGRKLESSNNSHHCITIAYIVEHFDWETDTT